MFGGSAYFVTRFLFQHFLIIFKRTFDLLSLYKNKELHVQKKDFPQLLQKIQQTDTDMPARSVMNNP